MNAAIHRRLTIIENKLRKCCGEELLSIPDGTVSRVKTYPYGYTYLSPTPLKKKNKKGKSKNSRKKGGAAAKVAR